MKNNRGIALQTTWSTATILSGIFATAGLTTLAIFLAVVSLLTFIISFTNYEE